MFWLLSGSSRSKSWLDNDVFILFPTKCSFDWMEPIIYALLAHRLECSVWKWIEYNAIALSIETKVVKLFMWKYVTLLFCYKSIVFLFHALIIIVGYKLTVFVIAIKWQHLSIVKNVLFIMESVLFSSSKSLSYKVGAKFLQL